MRLLLCLFVYFFCQTILCAQPEKRLALLIGNGNYTEAPLKNPAKDAQALGGVLEGLGFTTTIRTNRSLSNMKRDINLFRDQVKKAKQSGYRTIACVYYSGHGMQIGGTNYLIPIAHQIEDQVDVEREAYPADVLLKKLQLATADVNIVILDACRNNPFERSLKGRVKDLFPELEEGLADIGTPTVGTLIAYATAPGKVANDGDGSNSPYAKALIKYLPQAGITIEQAFRRVRNEVYASTRKTQTPWEASSLMGDDLYLKAPSSALSISPTRPKQTSHIATPKGMKKVDGGSFTPSESNGPTLSLSPFLMDQYEVTFAQFDAFCTATGREKPDDEGWGRGNRPVIHVDWYDAIEYCNWRSAKEGLQLVYTIDKTREDPNNKNVHDNKRWLVSCNWNVNGYRLPTETEWKYAAGGGKTKPDKWSGTNAVSTLSRYANYNKQVGKTTAVGTYLPSQLGLYDMNGNIIEWCWDWHGNPPDSREKNPTGPSQGQIRVLCGGSWLYTNISATSVKSQDGIKPDRKNDFIGFRCVRTY